ncbi:uncharacterized protein MELLADRAFT_94297 [Melampsora larici-populina 98AG31]|uniref:Uncharacterized protein n=1 Tax=Melampsora larici-populina (strain 98AG31 / pathotype 3-4-7) TaxID=747676 RepID=F4S778_MELLP|nr:uncharacterized protein MELLADRAFT_94297 [Melampsora larici-populina 98AG31]EGF99519.1 hypothetical protein MELLADRAFT_94297 [Melampsora larici-populina 98AG31]
MPKSKSTNKKSNKSTTDSKAPVSPAARLLAAGGARGHIPQRSVSKVEALSFEGLLSGTQNHDPSPSQATTSTSPIHPLIPNTHARVSFPSSSDQPGPSPPISRTEDSRSSSEAADTDVLRHLKTSLRSRLTSDHARQIKSPTRDVKSSSSSAKSSRILNRHDSTGSVPSSQKGSPPLNDSQKSPSFGIPSSPAAASTPGINQSSPSHLLLDPYDPSTSTQSQMTQNEIQADKHMDSVDRTPNSSLDPLIDTVSGNQATDIDHTQSDPSDTTAQSSPRLSNPVISSDILPALYVPVFGFKLAPPNLAQRTISCYPTSHNHPIADIILHLMILPWTTTLALVKSAPVIRDYVTNSEKQPFNHSKRRILFDAAQQAVGLVLAGSWTVIGHILNPVKIQDRL